MNELIDNRLHPSPNTSFWGQSGLNYSYDICYNDSNVKTELGNTTLEDICCGLDMGCPPKFWCSCRNVQEVKCLDCESRQA